jgi:hypothetical protein
MTNKRRSREELKEVSALVERLRDFIRVNYTTAAEVARQIGVRDTTIYDWLLGRARPAKPERIAAYLNSLPKDHGSGIPPTGYEYREYKNWRGIAKPRRCPFWGTREIHVILYAEGGEDTKRNFMHAKRQSSSETTHAVSGNDRSPTLKVSSRLYEGEEVPNVL